MFCCFYDLNILIKPIKGDLKIKISLLDDLTINMGKNNGIFLNVSSSMTNFDKKFFTLPIVSFNVFFPRCHNYNIKQYLSENELVGSPPNRIGSNIQSFQPDSDFNRHRDILYRVAF